MEFGTSKKEEKRGRPRRKWYDDVEEAVTNRDLEEDGVFKKEKLRIG